MQKIGIMYGALFLSLSATIYLFLQRPEIEPDTAPPSVVTEGFDSTEIESELAALRRQIKLMNQRIDRRLGQLETQVRHGTSTQDGGAATVNRESNPSGMNDDRQSLAAAVVERVEGQLEEKLERIAERQSQQNGGGQWKAPMDRLREELNLNDDEASAANEVFNEGKDRALELLGIERPDGGSLLSDLVADVRAGDPHSGQKLLGRIMTESVPGQERTYLAAFSELTETVQNNLGEHLSESQMDTLATLNVAILEVDTGHNPVRDHVREALSR